ncbi:MAG: DUF423 domain-containing protein [Bacteroidetes bacterium]|nr:DUF423 domain-containing protein [Bacteroidota bacterium]
MHKSFLVTAAILGAASVAIGAFGAHGLKSILNAEALTTYETAVRYQFYHVFALALTGVLYQSFPNKKMIRAGYFFIAGIVLFSGSLYLLTLAGPAYRWLGAITPFGGVCFITGWLHLAAGIRDQGKTGSGKL